LGAFDGRGRGSGVEFHAKGAWKDGLIVELRTFGDWQEALEAAGLSE